MSEFYIDLDDRRSPSKRLRNVLIVVGSMIFVFGIFSLIADFTVANRSTASLLTSCCNILLGILLVLQALNIRFRTDQCYIRIDTENLEYRLFKLHKLKLLPWDNIAEKVEKVYCS